MSKVLKIFLAITIVSLLMLSVIGCGSPTRGSTATQSSTQSTQQKTDSSNQQTSGVQKPQMGQDNSNMNAVLSRVAEILGVSETEFTTAFQNAMSANMPEIPEGQQGEPHEGGQPPEDDQQPPEGEGQNMPPGGQDGQRPSFDMTSVYEEVAETLNISADDIASAFEQAQQELISK